jgi:hypothetical protein
MAQVVGMMDETALLQLPPIERAERYRQYAEAMRSRAASAVTRETRMGFLRMAVGWLDMADKLEAEYGKVSVVVQAPALAVMLRRTEF